MAERREVATLAGGCFWCLEAVYDLLDGVEKVEPGYAGGDAPSPTYAQVCGGGTGHAEVVQITYDPDRIAYGDLLDVFFTIHDPTTMDRQGADVGSQYRSAILYHDDEQKHIAEQKIDELESQHLWSDPIVTIIEPLDHFWPAEDYHSDYYMRNASQPYCQIVIAPKVAKARAKFIERLRREDA